MAFKLIQAAEKNWRRLDGHELIPLVRAGTKFENGKRIEREDAMKKNDENSEKVAA